MIGSSIDEIKNRLDIVEVIGSYIKLKKAGINYKALCPFHSEKNPSLFVSPTRQIWHCFGCGRGGDIFAFIKEIENVEFGDALRILAQRAGVELKPMRPELRTERQRLYEICELATKFFEKQLEGSSIGKEAKKYLLSRGILEESIKKWRLGYSPDSWEGLSGFLVSRDYKKEEIEKAGLAIKSEKGSFFDRFRGRIIFPIFDLNSQVVGFSARVFKNPDPAKYINTPNTLLYDKSRILYGLDKAKVEIRKKDTCILVEGNTDVILAHQSGWENTVATSGTALSPYQLKILKRYSENLMTAFDMDVAGETATKRGVDLAQLQGFNIKVVRLPGGKDPAEIIPKNLKEWEEGISKAKSILDFYFESAFSGRDPKTSEGKKEISKILLPVLKKIPNQIEKSFWIQRLAKELEVREEDLREELKKVRLEENFYGLEPEEIASLPPKSRRELLEERLITMILKSGNKNLDLIEEDKISYCSLKGQEILNNLKKNPNFPRGPSGGWWEGWSPEKFSAEAKEYFNYLSLKAEVEEIEEKDMLSEIQFCLKELSSLEIKSKLDLLSQEIKKAEGEKDAKKIEKLIQEFNQLAKGIT